MAENAGFAAIRNALAGPDYRNYAVGNLCSHVGTWVQRVAVGWLTWELTKSTTWLGIIAFAEMAPTVVVAPLAGAIADRINRLKGTRVTQFLALLQAVALALLTVTGIITIEWLLALTAFHGMVLSFNQPLRLTIIPSLVKRRDLAAAIGISSLSFNVGRIGGPALSGLIILQWGVAPAFAFNAASYVIFLVTLFMIRAAAMERPPERRPLGNIPAEIMEGYRYAARHAGIGPLLVLLCVIAVFGRPFMELLPGFSAQVFGRGADGLAMLTSSIGVGAMLGGVWLAQRGAVAGLTRMVVVNVLVLGIALLGFTSTTNFWAAMPFIALGGFAMVVVGVGEQTLLQNAVSGGMRGRVLSLYGMINRGAPALGALVMGWLSSFYGLRWPVAGGAAFCLLVWLWAWPRRKDLAEALEGEPEDG